MSEDYCYVPILKAKEGELIALRQLATELKPGIKPLIELQPRDTEEKLRRTVRRIEQSWPADVPIFIDIDQDYLRSQTLQAVENLRFVYQALASDGFVFTPVTGLARPTAFNGLVSDVLRDLAHDGLCIRLTSVDLSELASFDTNIHNCVHGSSLKHSEIDLLLDYAAFLPSHLGTIVTSAVTAFNAVSNINIYRSLIFTATAFPPNVSAAPYTVYRFPRSEYQAWNTLIANPKLKRKPIFGDYTTIHPVLPDIDFKYGIRVAPKIKYASEAEWLFLRWDASDFSRFRDVCSILAGLPEYSGGNYSWGDGRILQCSTGAGNTGNPREWVSIGVNHHLTLVAQQCASQPVT